jgi:DNA-binding NtrC family response regulator
MNEVIEVPTHVMVVDDEQAFTEMLVLSLKEKGYDATAAFSGRECLEKLAGTHIDVVILDIKMPGMDGIETLKEIKKRHPIVQVIMLTGHGSIETSIAGMKLGAFDYLLKPAEFDILLEKVNSARRCKNEQEERIRKAEAHQLLIDSHKGGKLFKM